RITAIYGPKRLAENGLPANNALPDVEYVYDNQTGNLLEVHKLIDPAIPRYATNAYVYGDIDHRHFITKILDPRKQELPMVANTFDTQGRLISTSQGATDTKTTSLFHDLNNRREIITDASGNRTIHEYDSKGNVVRTINALAEVTSRSYDDDNNLRSETDPLGHTTSYACDNRGNQTQAVDSLGNQTTSAFDRFDH